MSEQKPIHYYRGPRWQWGDQWTLDAHIYYAVIEDSKEVLVMSAEDLAIQPQLYTEWKRREAVDSLKKDGVEIGVVINVSQDDDPSCHEWFSTFEEISRLEILVLFRVCEEDIREVLRGKGEERGS